MFADIKNYCLTCEQCLKFKNKILPTDTQLIPKNELFPGMRLHIDLVGKLNRSLHGHVFILTILDSYSRFLHAVPLTNIHASTIIHALNNYFSLFGLAHTVVSDNGTSFCAQEFESFLSALGIQHNKTSIYHPRSNGILERRHSTLKSSLACMANENNDWNLKLLYFILSYNTTPNVGTGYSPAELFFARELKTPFSLNFENQSFEDYSLYLKTQIENIKHLRKEVANYEEKYIGKHNMKHKQKCKEDLNIDDLVYITNFQHSGSFAPKYNGPLKVLKVFRNKNYLLQDLQDPNAKTIKVHREKIVKVPKKRDNLC